MRRIGPKMQAAVDYVRENPGCAILPVAREVGPNGSTRFGYEAVWRSIRAGLIQVRRRSNGAYCLRVRSLA